MTTSIVNPTTYTGGNGNPKRQQHKPTGFWSRLAKATDLWEKEEEEIQPKTKRRLSVTPCKYQSFEASRYHSPRGIIREALKSTRILVISIVTLILLLGIGLAIILVLRNNIYKQLNTIENTSYEVYVWFGNEFEKVLYPLFVLQSFVIRSPQYRTIPIEIQTAPPLDNNEPYTIITKGICDNAEYVVPFYYMTLPYNASSLLFMELWPNGVSCFRNPFLDYSFQNDYNLRRLFDTSFIGIPSPTTSPSFISSPPTDMPTDEPSVNTKDTISPTISEITQEAIIDTAASQITIPKIDTTIVGKDYASDPATSNQISTIYNCPLDKSIVNGPYSLYTNSSNYNVLVASTPIPLATQRRRLENNTQLWGIASIVLDWDAFVKESGLFDVFQERNLEFVIKNKDNTIITQSANANPSSNSISYTIPITNNEWTILISQTSPSLSALTKSVNTYSNWMIFIITLTSILISIMLLIILVDQQEQKTLLEYLIPSKIVPRVHRNEVVIERYEEATVFVGQIIGFAALTGQISPVEVITLLNEIYEVFDSLVQKHKLVKVETMGDVYVVIGGGPELNSTPENGAEKIANFALDVVDFVGSFKVEEGLSVFIRSGLASGHIIAGVIGSINKTFPKYSLFGDLLNWASLLQSTSKKMRIQTSETTYNLLMKSKNFNFRMKERMDGGGVVLSDIAVPDVSTRTFWLTSMTSKT